MSFLPSISKGPLTGQAETSAVQSTNTNQTVWKKRGQKNRSLLEISQNLSTIYYDNNKTSRSRSHDPPSSGDEFEHRKMKKAKMDRSKSLGHGDRKMDQNRKMDPIRKRHENANYFSTDQNNNHTGAGASRRSSDKRVRFDSSSEESYGKNNSVKRSKFQTSTPKTSDVHYRIRNINKENSLEVPQDSSNDGSLIEPRRKGTPGTHQARLEAARAKARNWSETNSDPGPSVRSIDNDKVIRGQAIDPRKGRAQTENARAKHAQYMNQNKQDGRPRAADKGRRLQSLPSKKEPHVSQTEDRSVISAPAKEQAQRDVPMPKINTLVAKEPTSNKTSEPKPDEDSNKQTEPEAGNSKPMETTHGTATVTAVTEPKSEVKEPVVETKDDNNKSNDINMKQPPPKTDHKPTEVTTKQSTEPPQPQQEVRRVEDRKTTKPEKPKEKQATEARPTEEKDINMAEREDGQSLQIGRKFGYNFKRFRAKHNYRDRNEAFSSGRLSNMSKEIYEDAVRFEEEIASMRIRITGIAGRGVLQEDENKRDGKRKLPADDHGPVIAPLEPVHSTKPNEIDESKFKYYASEKERMAKLRQESQAANDSAQDGYQSEKSWTTIKTKTTADTKPSILSPRKSQTTYGFSSLKDTDSKRREVTIVDPKALNTSDEVDDEPFMHEYEYHHNQETRHKRFDDMTDEEKVEYFRDQLHMKPDQIRELTFHPKVTEPKVIHHTYTGLDTLSWSARRTKSGKRSKSRVSNVYKRVTVVPPSQRKSAMLSKLQGTVYRHINQIYGSSPRDDREKQFFEKLAQIQIDDMQRRYEMLAEKERKTLEAKFRQREQLKRLRRKFEDDAWRRFMTQYVTSKVIEAEYRNREEYGLPNDIGRPRHSVPVASKVHAKRIRHAITPKRMHKRNEQKYSNIFRFNTGPIPKTGGKPLKFEGYDTVYLDTEDENGKPVRKKQNVDALMREAQRILDQSDDVIDIEETPRKAHSERTRPHHDRPHRHRSRKHIPDDKSHKSSHTSRSKASRSQPPPPKTMKELIARRKSYAAAPATRYQASSFTAIKADLLKGSDMLNKNEKLKNTQQAALLNKDKDLTVTSKSDDKPSQSKPVSIRSDMRTPPASPVPHHSEKVVKTTVVTKTTRTNVTENVTTTDNADEASAKNEWKVKDGNVYLDQMETQMAIDTARDKSQSEEKKKKAPSRAPSRISSKIEQTGHAPARQADKNVSRAPSRISFRAQQDQTSQKDIKPPRAPSRTSVAVGDDKMTKLSGRYSRASVAPISEIQPSPNRVDAMSKRSESRASRTKTESVFLTETDNDIPTNNENQTIKGISDSKVSVRQNDRISNYASTTTLQRELRASVGPSPQSQNQSNSKTTSVVNISSTNGRVSPAVDREPPTRRESMNVKEQEPVRGRHSSMDRVSDQFKRRESVISRHDSINRRVSSVERVSVRGGQSPYRKPETSHVNGDISSESQPKVSVTKNVTVSENITETTHVDVKSNKTPIRSTNNEPKRSVDNSNSDVLSSKKATYHDRKEESIHNKEKPKPRERPTHKAKTSKSKKSPARKRSRSRTPQRESITNGHAPDDDIKMDMKKYEEMRQHGRLDNHRSGSVEGSGKGRRKSTSRGRKTSVSKGRKRSSSSERRKSKQGKSRFPDIHKVDDEWKISARSPVQNVNRTVREDEYEPKPAKTSQWKDLVEKYIRQPSPKIGKTEDRSLLDANLDDDDDDDEMDIFKRAQMKYKLNVDTTDEDDSDA